MFRWCPADVFPATLTAVLARTRTRGGPIVPREKERGRKKEKERAGGASIYQRRREVGGCMRRIAPYGRSLINSGRRRSGGASVRGQRGGDCRRSSSERNDEGSASEPPRSFAALRAYLERTRQRPVSSADGERACANMRSAVNSDALRLLFFFSSY